MKKSLVIATAIAVPAIGMAQGAVDAANMSQLEMRGTARFMAMGGAFTALGGDLSTLAQNPAGIGIYRSSEIGITADLNFQSFKTSAASSYTKDQTKFNINNFGYVGTAKLYSESCPTISFGATYQRINSFDRISKGNMHLNGASLSNYVAAFTNAQGSMGDGYSPYSTGDLSWGTNYDPYNYADWMSVLAYNGMIMSDAGGTNSSGQASFQGLMGDGTTGSANFDVREKGYVDEYNITLGGNIYNTVFWGIGFGITDIDYTQYTYYGENLTNAYIEAQGERSKDWYNNVRGTSNFGLTNYLHSTGSGFNVKLGLIVKPINEFRIGLAVHTPTWYSMTDTFWGDIATTYQPNSGQMTSDGEEFVGGSVNELTDDSQSNWVDYRLRTPWRIMVGAAGVIGGQGIISADYEYRGSNMQIADYDRNEYTDVTDDVETYYKGVNIFRLGGEYRVTPQFSVRAGFCYESSPVDTWVADDNENINFSGTIPSYSFNKSTRYLTAGLGYRSGGFYVDFAFVNKHRQSTWHAFSPIVAASEIIQSSPSATITSNYNQAVLSLGYKF
jgi:hypothetical protein